VAGMRIGHEGFVVPGGREELLQTPGVTRTNNRPEGESVNKDMRYHDNGSWNVAFT